MDEVSSLAVEAGGLEEVRDPVPVPDEVDVPGGVGALRQDLQQPAADQDRAGSLGEVLVQDADEQRPAVGEGAALDGFGKLLGERVAGGFSSFQGASPSPTLRRVPIALGRSGPGA